MANDKYKPKQQSAEAKRALQPEGYTNSVPPARTDFAKREYQTRREGSPKPPHIGLQDIDESIMYYFSEVIEPTVMQNNKKIKVPIMYGSPERWANVQKDGALRDKNGKFMAPLIMFKRTSLSKNRGLTNKMDANNPSNFIAVKNTYTRSNVYDNFSVLTNRRPKEEYYASIVPDFVTITYSCTAFTDYVDQMNKIIEAANFAEDSYWGDSSKFMFRARIDTFGTTVEVGTGTDRVVTTNFDIVLNGYVIPEIKQADINNFRKYFSKAQLFFNFEVAGDLEELIARADAAPVQPGVRFFDAGVGAIGAGAGSKGMNAAEILYTSLSNTTFADIITTDTATFNEVEIAIAPNGFELTSKKHFSLYVNGQFVPQDQIVSITQVNDTIVVEIDTAAVQYTLLPSFEIILVGKFNFING